MTTEQMDAVDAERGVWAVWSTNTRESLRIIFPKNQELAARRWADEQGYGSDWIEFIRFGNQLSQ